MRPRTASLAAVLLILGCGTAMAHSSNAEAAGFAAGMLHPLTGLDHLLAMVAVGVLAGRRGGSTLLLAPLAFVASMAAGFQAGLAGAALSGAEIGVAASVVILGLALAHGRGAPGSLLVGASGLFGLAHGMVHGLEAPASGSLPLYAAGLILTTLALHAGGAGFSAALRGRDGLVVARRAAGSAMAVYGATLFMAAS
jgi:urease accessory protein